MDQERVLAAVLLADVVGSTPLYERIGDDAALQQVSDCLDTIREIAARHGSDFIHSKGDDVLSLFERPEGALRAVRQIVSQLTRGSLTTRIGLHFGAVIRTRGEVFGDVVNVTARLSTAANPGEVLISQSFFEALSSEGRSDLRLLDKMPFKGKEEPFDVCRTLPRTGLEPRQHGHRRRRRRPGCRTRPHHACGLGPHQRAPRKTIRYGSAIVQDLLDRLPQGHVDAAENHDVPRLAVGRGG